MQGQLAFRSVHQRIAEIEIVHTASNMALVSCEGVPPLSERRPNLRTHYAGLQTSLVSLLPPDYLTIKVARFGRLGFIETSSPG